MKVLKEMKTVMLRLWHSTALKYAVVAVLGIAGVGFLGDDSLWSHIKNHRRIVELQEERARYDADYRRDQAQIRELEKNPKAMEKIARERYFMKADDEDIFVLSDDDRTPKSIVNDAGAE